MKMSKMVKVLTENQKTIIDALALGLRDEKFGKGEREFFENEDEMEAILHYQYRKLNEIHFLLDLEDDLKEERGRVAELVDRTLDYLANIDKAIESKGYWEIMEEWKEKRDAEDGSNRNSKYGDCEKDIRKCEEADKGDA